EKPHESDRLDNLSCERASPHPRSITITVRLGDELCESFAMNSLVVSSVLLASMICGIFVGVYLRSVLPDTHLDETAKDVVKMGTGLVAAVTGLVLALLTTSAKSAYDGQRTMLHQMSADIVLLDHLLVHFGPEGSETRVLLRKSARS